MEKEYSRFWSGDVCRFLSLFVFSILFFASLVVLASGFDVVYQDSEGDVRDINGRIYSSGFEHIDILEVRSSSTQTSLEVTLRLVVAGLIVDSESVSYDFMLMSGQDAIYHVSYSNGTCTGVSYSNYLSEPLTAEGAGTDTLTVGVRKASLGTVSDYDISANTWENMGEDEDWNAYMDSCPGEPYWWMSSYSPIQILDPRNGSTVFGPRTIAGVADGVVDVEVSFDADVWLAAATSDSWETWEFPWDIEGFEDGRQQIHARGFDGVDYAYHSIVVFIDRNAALDPPSMDMPSLAVGDWFVYDIVFNMPDDVEYYDDMTFRGGMRMNISGTERLDTHGGVDVYVVEMVHSLEMAFAFDGESFDATYTTFSKQYMRQSDLAVLKVDMRMVARSSESFLSMTMNRVLEYETPLERYSFPLVVGERWKSSATVTDTMSMAGFDMEEGDVSNAYNHALDCEVLRRETVTTDAGDFETFVIWIDEDSGDGEMQSASMFGLGGSVIEYLSPELGMPVLYEYRDLDGAMEISVVLRDYGSAEYEEASLFSILSEDMPWFLFPLIIALLLAVLLFVVKRRRIQPRPVVEISPLMDLDDMGYAMGLPAVGSGENVLICTGCSRPFLFPGGAARVRCPFCWTGVDVGSRNS